MQFPVYGQSQKKWQKSVTLVQKNKHSGTIFFTLSLNKTYDVISGSETLHIFGGSLQELKTHILEHKS